MTDRPDQPQDPGRRRFFRQFAGEVATSVGSVLGAAQVLQQQSAEAARELLAGDEPGGAPTATSPTTSAAAASAARAGALPDVDASTADYRTPLRWDGDV